MDVAIATVQQHGEIRETVESIQDTRNGIVGERRTTVATIQLQGRRVFLRQQIMAVSVQVSTCNRLSMHAAVMVTETFSKYIIHSLQQA